MEKKFDDEIDLVWILQALLRKVWLIVAVAVVVACGMAGYTKFAVRPTYSSTATILVLTKETTLTSLTDLQIGSQLTKDYTVLIKSRPVLEEVIENLGLEMSYKQLKGQIMIVNPEDTRILNITVTVNDPKQAKAIVDELAVVSSKFVGDKMEVTPPKIIEEGEINLVPTSPNISQNALIGFMAGALLISVIIVVLELMNDTIRTEMDIEKYLGIPTLANVPTKTGEQKKEKYLPATSLKKGRTK